MSEIVIKLVGGTTLVVFGVFIGLMYAAHLNRKYGRD